MQHGNVAKTEKRHVTKQVKKARYQHSPFFEQRIGSLQALKVWRCVCFLLNEVGE
jgi:hypothetical protein